MTYQKRAYKVNHNYGSVKRTDVVGGAKAGRYFKAAEARRRAVRLDNKKRTISQNIKLLKRIFDRGVIITFTIAMLCAAFQVGINHETQEAQGVSQEELPHSIPLAASGFESADMPANYQEPDLFETYFKSEANIARAICRAESGLNAKAISKVNRDGSRDWGICQINDRAHRNKYQSTEQLLDPEFNVKTAKQIRDSWESWNAWTVYKSGAYKKYL